MIYYMFRQKEVTIMRRYIDFDNFSYGIASHSGEMLVKRWRNVII